MFKRTAIASLLVLACVATAAHANEWFWELGGGQNPATIQTNRGTTLFPASSYSNPSSEAGWESVATGPGSDTAMRIFDNSAAGNPWWNQSSTTLIPPDQAIGMTLAFRIKAESCSASSGSPVNIIAVNTHFSGGPQSRLTMRMYTGADGKIYLRNRDVSGDKVISDGWHSVWVRLWNYSPTSYQFEQYFDDALWASGTKGSTGDPAGAAFGYNSSGGTAAYQLDYLAWAIDGAYSLNSLPVPTYIPEPGTLGLAALAAVPLLRRRTIG